MGASAEVDSRRFLLPEVLVKLRRLDLIARLVVEGFVTGLHKSPFHGFSAEFAEYREYSPGDEIKHVDWKVFGRTDRYYIKVFEEETNLQAHILVDCSESMAYKSSGAAVSKLEYASYIAASLAFLVLNQRDSVGLFTFDEAVREAVPPSQNPSHLKLITQKLEQAQAQGTSVIGETLERLAESVRRKGLFILISDLFDDPVSISKGLRHLRHRRHEVIVFNVLDPAERTFPFTDMLKFEGLEDTGEQLIDPVALRESYLEELESFLTAVKTACRQTRTDYVLMDTSMPLNVALVRYLATRSEVKLR